MMQQYKRNIKHIQLNGGTTNNNHEEMDKTY